jgi:hypothetical protein
MKLVALVMALVIGHGVAHACQCSRSNIENAARAKSVVVGVVDSVQTNGTSVTYTLTVESVWRGAAWKTMTVSGPLDDCVHSSAFAVGERLLIVGRKIAMCNGSGPATTDTVAALDKKLGKHHKPR